MEYRYLGRTGLKVSRFCFGTLTVGPLQARLDIEEAGRLMAQAYEHGVNFIDTAEIYGTYPHIRAALERIPRDSVIISSKSYSYEYSQMQRSVEKALREIGTDYIDIFLLHEQESRWTMKGHEPALRYLLDAKEKGLVRAVGVSTHAVEVVAVSREIPEIDVIHPMYNMRGIGIIDGGLREMEREIEGAHREGKGIFSMKALGGGNLLREGVEALRYVAGKPFIDSIAIGVKNTDELILDLEILSGASESASKISRDNDLLQGRPDKRLRIEDWCEGCGNCEKRCPNRAIAVDERRRRAVVDAERCLLCGYCGSVCPVFAIKVY